MSTTEIRCLCGAVTIRLEGEPAEQFYCHCEDCRAAGGGAYVGVALYPAEAVAVEGETAAWTQHSLPRHRCARCGTQLYGEVPGLGQLGIKANLLPPGMFRPAFHIRCRSALLPVHDTLPHYADLPARWGGSDETVAWP